MLRTGEKNRLYKLLKISILALWGGIILLELQPAQAGEIQARQYDLSLTAFSVTVSDSARLQMYTLLPIRYVSQEQNGRMGVSQGYRSNEPSLYINSNISSADYSSYRLDRSYPGVGMRYSVEQEWFLYGETRMANYRPRASEPQLFHPDEPRSILIGGGIHF